MSEKAKILLVDDRPENLLALEAILEPLEQELVRAESGEEALRRLLHDEYALILLDVQMPQLDGFETAGLIKQRERTRRVPIIFLTAISKDAEHVFRGYEAGAVDYITKPFDPTVLRSKVGVFVELWQTTVELRRHEEALREREVAAVERESEERYRLLAETVPEIVWTTTADGHATFYNRRWYEYTGLAPDADADPRDVVHVDDLGPLLERWEEAHATSAPFETEYRLRRADGRYRWHLVRACPMRDDDGAISGWVGAATDIDDRRAIEERQRFLAEAGWVLGSSLDYERTLADVAQLAVPRVADWCAVDIFVGGRLERVALEHVDPLKVALARELERTLLTASGSAGAAAIRQRQPVLVERMDAAALATFGFDERELEIAAALDPRSYITVPLVARGEVLGAISLVHAESGRSYGEGDLVLAQELARHAATAIDNARLYEEAARRAQAARVLASVGDGVVLVDRDGVVRLWNSAAAAIVGLREEDVLGRRIDDVIPRWSEIARMVPVASSPAEPVRAETTPIDVGGRELWISGSGVELEEGVVYAFRDLTEEHVLERMRSELVATVSHELRTPLAAIYGSAQTIRRRDLELGETIRNELLDVIATESDRLARIVNDLLLSSHLDSGQLPLRIESCDAAELAAAVVESARTHLPEGIELELDAPESLPRVAADPGQLGQVLTNVLDNAIKYSPGGGTVSVRVRGSEGTVRFSVSDRGLGMPASELHRIFEKFYRLDPGMSRGIGGTGLGLYITRELVRRMNGTISVDSRVGKGSTFVVELPAAAPQPVASASAPSSSASPSSSSSSEIVSGGSSRSTLP